MVRRRGRPPKQLNEVVNGGEGRRGGGGVCAPSGSVAVCTSANLLEEQYFASPKRKDCKVDDVPPPKDDDGTSENEICQADSLFTAETLKFSSRQNDVGNMKTERNIAKTSQIRTIENYFKGKDDKTAKHPAYQHEEEIVDDEGNLVLEGLPTTKATPLNGHKQFEKAQNHIFAPISINDNYITVVSTINSDSSDITSNSPSLSYVSSSISPVSSPITKHIIDVNGSESSQNDVEEYYLTISEENSNESNTMRLVGVRGDLVEEDDDDCTSDVDIIEHHDLDDLSTQTSEEAYMSGTSNNNNILDLKANSSDEATSNGSLKNNIFSINNCIYKDIKQITNEQCASINLCGGRSSRTSSTNTNASSSCYSNNTTENIFLQEPVLSLNVDKTPNQASSIKINKSLEIEPVFSSATIAASFLHGQFNQIVSLNSCSANRLNFNESFNSKSPENDSNFYDDSEDSNDKQFSESNSLMASEYQKSLRNANEATSIIESPGTVSRRQKPATPHRIVCPSPTKTAAPRAVSPIPVVGRRQSPAMGVIKKKEQIVSPRKSPRHHLPPASAASAQNYNVAPRTRRRLKEGFEGTVPAILKSPRKAQTKPQRNQKEKPQAASPPDNDEEVENLDYFYHDNCEAVADKMKKPQEPQKTKTNKSQQTQAIQPKTINNSMTQQKIFKKTSNNNGNSRELTEFFQVRRSERKTKTAVKEEMMRNLEQAVLEERAEGLKVAYFDGKGRGVIADRHFQRGEFVVEYIGDLISMSEAVQREQRYALDEKAGCYMYYFKHKNQQYCIDATVDTGKLGRLVNHSRNGNLITKVVVVKQRPHLILLAKDDIAPGEELTYDYGDRSKESLLHHPWLAY